jgi:hypothetical protein
MTSEGEQRANPKMTPSDPPLDDSMLRPGVRLEVLWAEDGDEGKWWTCSIEDYRLRKGMMFALKLMDLMSPIVACFSDLLPQCRLLRASLALSGRQLEGMGES